MAPAAKLRDKPIKIGETEPIMQPKNAPNPVITPDKVVKIIAFIPDIPLVFKGREMEIPSGIS